MYWVLSELDSHGIGRGEKCWYNPSCQIMVQNHFEYISKYPELCEYSGRCEGGAVGIWKVMLNPALREAGK